MKHIEMLFSTIAVPLLLLMGSVAMADDVVTSKAAERAEVVFDREQAMQNRRDLHRSLVAEQVMEAGMTPVSVPVSPDEQLEIDTAPVGIPERVGLTKPLSVGVSLAGVSLPGLAEQARVLDSGALKAADDGGYVFTSVVTSPGATAMRIRFAGFRLPANASLYLYTADGQVFGPYTGLGPQGDGEFWSHTLQGEKVIVQLRHRGVAKVDDLQGTHFQILEVGHLRPRFLSGACSFNAPCVVNLSCAVDVNNEAISDAKNAVAEILFTSGSAMYLCSGGLLADLDTATQIPYFLTANHCISRNAVARTLEAFFQRIRNNCDTECGNLFDHPQELRVLGSTVKSTSTTSDYTLMSLNQPAPAGSTYLGWDATPVADQHGKDIYRISHPQGAPQSYSENLIDATAGTCTAWPRGKWIYSQDTYGAIEGGSSGSPVVSADGKVLGQLSGGCGWVDERGVCDFEHKRTVDGAFAAYYSSVKKYLLLPSGAACTSNDQCASGSCRLRGGVRTCN